MTERDDALATIVRLARDHDLSAAKIESALAGDEDRPPGRIARVFAYLGGAFIFAGVAAFISLNWDVFPSVLRVLVTLGVGASFFAAAVVIERDGRWPHLVTPFYLIAEILQPTGLLVAFEEYGGGGDPRYAVLITGALSLVQAVAVFRTGGNAVLLFAAIGFGFAVTATLFDLAGVSANLATIVLGLALVLSALGLDPRYRWTRNLWLIAGAVMFFFCSFEELEGTAFEALYIIIAAGGVALGVQLERRALMGVSTLALIAWLSWFTAEYFADSLGWPFVLMLIGAILTGGGIMALKLNQRYFQ